MREISIAEVNWTFVLSKLSPVELRSDARGSRGTPRWRHKYSAVVARPPTFASPPPKRPTHELSNDQDLAVLPLIDTSAVSFRRQDRLPDHHAQKRWLPSACDQTNWPANSPCCSIR